MRSHGSCPPFDAVQRFWMCPAPPAVELASHVASVLETSIGKFELVPEAIEAVDVTVMER
jgi:hypothetical protein